MKTNAWKQKENGFTLLEVLIGIVIFALGMMALAQLQGGLARNSADSNARTVATNIAEEMIEAARTFSQITTDPAGIKRAYQRHRRPSRRPSNAGRQPCSPSSPGDRLLLQQAAASAPPAPGAARSDMKLLEVTVTWGNSDRSFRSMAGHPTRGPTWAPAASRCAT